MHPRWTYIHLGTISVSLYMFSRCEVAAFMFDFCVCFRLTMFTVLSQKLPYREPQFARMNLFSIRDKITSGSRPTLGAEFDSAPYIAMVLMQRCWATDPNDRPASFRSICKALLVCVEQKALGKHTFLQP